MKTLNHNYASNLAILKENLKRGMSVEQASKVINNFEQQFINNNLYGSEEKSFIRAMRALLINETTHINVVTD